MIFNLRKFLFVLVAAPLLINAQPTHDSLFVPLNIQEAYKNGTRSYDGRPGESYWQNRAVYDIRAELNPATRELSGFEKITYFNNSPDKLGRIVIRIYQDFYKKGNVRDFQVNPVAVNDGVNIGFVILNGDTLDLKDRDQVSRFGTNMSIEPEEAIGPGEKTELEIKWSFTIPKESGVRMGTYDSTSFFVSYWYPQVSVYDDIDGWDVTDYAGIVEMYNDFNDYSVELTLPEGFTAWGTGVLENPGEIFTPEILERTKTASASDTVINIITEQDYEKGNIFRNDGKTTWKFTADYVPDFAFATSNHYLWDLTSYKTPAGNNVLIGAAYNRDSEDFYGVAEIARKSIKFFSEEMPAIPYPYPTMTIFNGSGGMEYPMIVNDGSTSEYYRTMHVTSHEIAHTYFPFYMGTNERKYAWMDEGFATMLPFEFQDRESEFYDPVAMNVLQYAAFAGSEKEMPMMIPSDLLGGLSYRATSYRRAGVAFHFLRKAMGDETFTEALHDFIHTWNGKHPLPWDFFYSFNRSAGTNLAWFWKPWFFERGYPDLAIESAEETENGNLKVTVHKKGNIPVPVKLTVKYTGDTESEFTAPVTVWENNDRYTMEIEPGSGIEKISIGDMHIPDSVPANNTLTLTTSKEEK